MNFMDLISLATFVVSVGVVLVLIVWALLDLLGLLD